MKNEKQGFALLMCLLFLSFSSLLYGQKNEEYVFSQNQQSINYKTLTLGDRVYSIGSTAECPFPVLNRNTEETEDTWYVSSGMYFSDLMLMTGQDSLILTCGYYHELGDIAPFEKGPRVVAFDLEGTVVFDVLLPFDEDHLVDRDMELTINGSGQIVVEMGARLYWLAANGDFQKMQAYADVEFVDIDPWNATTMLGLTKDKLYWLTNEGDKMDSLTINQEAQDLWIGHGKIYVLSANELVVINSPSDTEIFTLSPQDISAKGLAGNEESLIVWGEDLLQGNSKIIQIEKDNYGVIEEVLFDEEQTEVVGLEVVGEELILSGLTQQDFEDFHFAYIKRTELLKAPSFYEEALSFDNFKPINKLDLVTEQFQGPGPDSIITIYYYRAFPLVFELEVTNNGTDTLRSFSFYSNNHSIFDCVGGRMFRYYENLVIPPGESFTLLDSTNLVFAGTTKPEVPPLNLAIFSPNDHFEKDFSDNQQMFDFPVGLNPPLPLVDRFFELNPNPAQDFAQLVFHGNEKIKDAQITLFDLQGKRLFAQSTDLVRGESLNFNTQDLPAGLYFLNILSSDQLISKKLIIQR